MIEKERIAAYLFSLEKDMPAFLEQLEKRAIADGVPIIRKSTQQVLRFLMAMVQPEEILEVGTAVGFSGIFMMTFLEKYRSNGHLTTIEKVSYRIEQAKENFQEAGLSEKVTLLEGDAGGILKRLAGEAEMRESSSATVKIIGMQETFSKTDGARRPAGYLEESEKKGKQYDMIFMDAAKGQYLHFYPAVKKLLKPGGLLVSDNVLQDGTIVESRYSIIRRDRTIHERMRKYMYLLSHDEDFETVTLPMGDGLTLSYKMK